MGFRTVYGYSISENGWPMVDTGSCQWVTVPGTGVNLQIQQGQPLQILRAFAADFNEFVEPLRDADSACWTLTNSVGSSNHLSGTACDLNWDSHPFQIADAGFTDDKINAVRDLLDFYEDTMFWGNDWNSPKDAMHFQLGYTTFNNPKTASFIARKIRSDGYSTYQRGPIQAETKRDLTQREEYALAIIAEGQDRGITPRGIKIALATALVESDLLMYANYSVPESLNLPHDAVGSDYDSVGLFQQRCPMWGTADVLMDPAKSAGLFYDHLVDFDYNDESQTPGHFAQAVQVSAYPDRYDQHYADAETLYNRLAVTQSGDDMAQVPQDQWNFVYQELSRRYPSRSPLRHLGEGPVDTEAGMVLNTDGSVHVLMVKALAEMGDWDSLKLLAEVAGADPGTYPDRVHDANLARAILHDIETRNPAVITNYLKGSAA